MEVSRRTLVAVVGAGDADDALAALAREVGAALARGGAVVATGGRGGVMAAASRGARRAGGSVVGIVPSTAMAEGNRWCSVVIPTGLGHARNVVTALAGDVVVAIGGGAGTLSEIAFAWIHGRPIIVVKGRGGWADALTRRGVDARRSSTITAVADAAGCAAALRTLLRRVTKA